MFVWLKFIICAAIIFFAGSRLTRYGDAIAEKTGLCRAWIGLVLLASITSLPELANGISAAAWAKTPDLAAGDLLGACMMNMVTLSVLDLWWAWRGEGSIFIRPKEGNVISAFFGVAILLLVSFFLALSRLSVDFSFQGISVYSIVILVVYLLSLYVLGGHREEKETMMQKSYEHLSPLKTYFYFFVAAAFVVAAGSWLPFIGEEIVAVGGWSKTFVAVLFLAVATTLPEMTVSFSALRLGQIGMSIGNLVGSNVFDVSLLFLVDIFYRPASLYAAVSSNMIVAALSGAMLMAIAYVALKKQISNHIPSIIIIFLYLFSLYLLFASHAVT